ncbi:Uncharacterised protein [Prevotella disiens]|uniref:Uncharacterized protein n=1 Tax=Prevotella disiens TaxID=28130 RepID=A0A379E0W5_9BACT|nr:Uncharacterised protein [Prevotella disiens]
MNEEHQPHTEEKEGQIQTKYNELVWQKGM